MAGLVAAARLRQLGRGVVVLERGGRPGGSMLLSSGVVWRHRTLADFVAECPAGDRELQELVWSRLDDGLDWLEALGAPVLARETGNPLTTGRRFEARGLTEALVRAVEGASVSVTQSPIRLSTPLDPGAEAPLILATGGFGVRFARERGLGLRAAPWSDGAGIELARDRGAALASGQDEFYGRLMPAPPARWREGDFVRAAQLYGRFARAVDDGGAPVFQGEPAWHENDLAQAVARHPSAWLVVDDSLLQERVRGRTVADMVAAAEESGGEVRRAGGTTAVRVRAAVTHTLGGLRVDTRARVLDESGEPLSGLHAAGADAGGIFAGGYGSGLAAALVLGLVAAEDVAAVT
jgi:succinate dehydrogenase/fumarate reductase flavoprotein subunit